MTKGPGTQGGVPRGEGASSAVASGQAVGPAASGLAASELAAKRAEEAEMVSQMIALWCRGHHADVARAADAPHVRLGLSDVALCPACAELRAYALGRIGRCPHMGTKTFCSVCPTHCYRPEMRERIREVMRWSGPRMLMYRPVPAIRHAIVTVKAKRAARQR